MSIRTGLLKQTRLEVLMGRVEHHLLYFNPKKSFTCVQKDAGKEHRRMIQLLVIVLNTFYA